MADDTPKHCNSCKQHLPRDSFRFYLGKPVTYCRPCEKAKNAKWQAEHPNSRTPANRSWDCMKRRCGNRKHHAYKDYGGRGITVCERWMKFANFLEDMGERPEGTTLDRIDNSKGYYKENCRWATWHEQAWNRRLRKTNKTGVPGVHFSKSTGRWQAAVCYKGQRFSLYHGKSKAKAIAARKAFDKRIAKGEFS